LTFPFGHFFFAAFPLLGVGAALDLAYKIDLTVSLSGVVDRWCSFHIFLRLTGYLLLSLLPSTFCERFWSMSIKTTSPLYAESTKFSALARRMSFIAK
jgi:hypothetical protein